MDKTLAKKIADETIFAIFSTKNPFTLQQIVERFAFDVRKPIGTIDYMSGQKTWVQSTSPGKFISLDNANNKPNGYWKRSTRIFNSVEDVLRAWSEINVSVSERQLDSVGVAKSDNVYQSCNVYESLDITGSENVLYCDGISAASDHIIACQRSKFLRNCIRVEDSKFVENSFSVIWSKNIKNCLFISDASDLEDSIFCSHISKSRFCVANVQLSESEYYRVKELVVNWILKI